jgi:hypothetical protein
LVSSCDVDPPSRRLPHRIGVALTALLLLFVVVLFPLVLASVADELVGHPDGPAYVLTPAGPAAASYTRLHLAAVALDEEQHLLSLRVSGHHICASACAWDDRVVFFSLHPADDQIEGLPPSAGVTLPSANVEVTQTIQLPIHGDPPRYPFDSYELMLGVLLQRVRPDGSVQTLSPAEAQGRLFLTFRERLPRSDLPPPRSVDPATVRAEHDPYQYLYVDELTFQRPVYLQALSVLLVLLISAAAAYAVFIGRLENLLINYGTVVLGVWGIRAILTPGNQTSVTALDLSLALIIVFLLGAIAVRALLFHRDRGRHHPPPGAAPPRPGASSPEGTT